MAKISLIYYVFLLAPSLFIKNIEVTAQCDSGVVSFCQSCMAYGLCPSGGSTAPPQNFTCNAGTVCDESGNIGQCKDPSTAVTCRCTTNTATVTYQCDPFDDTYRFACISGIIQASEQCAAGESCMNGVCGPAQTTASAILLTTCSVANLSPTKFNCTAYYICSAGAEPSIITCAPGQIFSETTGSCIEYDQFDCSDVPGLDGTVADPFTCGSFYICSGGQGFQQSCAPGQIFNDTVSQCTAPDPDNPCTNNTCTPCTPAVTVFPSSTTSCESTYEQCVLNSTADGGYSIISKSCPGGFCFDPNTLFCTRQTSRSKGLKLNHKRSNRKSKSV